jgi:hypothetical protein
MEGRRAIGSEVDPQTHAKATARLSKPVQVSLFVPQPVAKQSTLLDI